MNAERLFRMAEDSDASVQQIVTLNQLEGYNSCDGSDGCEGCDGCDGCDGSDGNDGHIDELYEYMRLWQQDDTSTGQIRDKYWEQFTGEPDQFLSTLASSG
jgi:hypothetical protein